MLVDKYGSERFALHVWRGFYCNCWRMHHLCYRENYACWCQKLEETNSYQVFPSSWCRAMRLIKCFGKYRNNASSTFVFVSLFINVKRSGLGKLSELLKWLSLWSTFAMMYTFIICHKKNVFVEIFIPTVIISAEQSSLKRSRNVDCFRKIWRPAEALGLKPECFSGKFKGKSLHLHSHFPNPKTLSIQVRCAKERFPSDTYKRSNKNWTVTLLFQSIGEINAVRLKAGLSIIKTKESYTVSLAKTSIAYRY